LEQEVNELVAALNELEHPTPAPATGQKKVEAEVETPAPPAWTLTRRQYQESKALTAAGVPILDVADAREHQRLVREAVERGEDVPDHVLAGYPDLVRTHHRHPQNAGETLCGRSIGDDTRVSHDDDEVDCGECLCYARRGHDMYGREVEVAITPSVGKEAHAYEKYRVEAASVEDFLDRYYKPERFRGRGEDYAASLLASYTADLERDGYVIVSHHDSITGRVVAFFGPKGRAPQQPETAEPTESETLSRDETQADADVAYPVCDNALRNAFAAHRGGLGGGRDGLHLGLGHPPTCDNNKAVRVVTVYKNGDGETLSLCDECYQWVRKNARACGYRLKSQKLAVAQAEQAPPPPESATLTPPDPAPGPPAAASDDWTPVTEDQAEFERWELHLLTGETGKKSSAFHRALKQVARPGTLRLALLQVNGHGNEGRRRELLEKRLAALAGPVEKTARHRPEKDSGPAPEPQPAPEHENHADPKLPAGAFKASGTGVDTRVVVISKPRDDE
jgi:hypothetical protein